MLITVGTTVTDLGTEIGAANMALIANTSTQTPYTFTIKNNDTAKVLYVENSGLISTVAAGYPLSAGQSLSLSTQNPGYVSLISDSASTDVRVFVS